MSHAGRVIGTNDIPQNIKRLKTISVQPPAMPDVYN